MNDLFIYPSLGAALTEFFGHKCRILSAVPVSGGDINCAYRLTLTDGQKVFLKSNARNKLLMFRAEAAGLAAIAGTGAIRVLDRVLPRPASRAAVSGRGELF